MTPFDWKLWPETEALIDRWVGRRAGRQRLRREPGRSDATRRRTRGSPTGSTTSSCPIARACSANSSTLGFARRPRTYAVGVPVYAHDGGMFPSVAVAPGEGPEVREVAIRVESVAAFSRAHDLGLDAVGYPLGPYRVGRVAGEATGLAVVERRGYDGFEPFPGELAREGRMRPHAAREALAARELWQGRRRRFDDDDRGFDATEETLERVIERAGSRDLACHLVFEVERDYWQSRNRAARVQKARQDRLGLGWANHDHHTFRSSRRNFPRLIRHLRTARVRAPRAVPRRGARRLGCADPGAPDDRRRDLRRPRPRPRRGRRTTSPTTPLPDLPRPNTVGLWVGLHGESILEAGMHHLEAQFDFDGLRDGLKAEAGIETMTPFSDFPFLRQAFTAGERWAVDRRRADRCLASAGSTPTQHARFLREGAIGSHLENLQRRRGLQGLQPAIRQRHPQGRRPQVAALTGRPAGRPTSRPGRPTSASRHGAPGTTTLPAGAGATPP